MIHIVNSINSQFLQHFCAMAMSVMHNTNTNVHFHIINNDLTEKETIFIDKVFGKFKNANFSYYKIDDDSLKDIEIQANHLTIQTLYRLLIAEIIPASIDKILYLDADIVIESDIANLYQKDIGNYYLAAVNELYIPSVKMLELNISLDYFNAGVMLLNLKKWREDSFSNTCLKYALQNPEKLLLADQDILNGVLRGEWKRLPLEWNLVKGVWDNYEDYCNQYSELEIQSVIDNPKIIHYTSPSKPWQLLCNHLYKERYYYYLDMTGIKYVKYPEYQYISQKDNLFIFGSGKAGIEVLGVLKERNVQLKGFYDNDPKKWRTKVHGFEVYSPENCGYHLNDFIIIASMYHKEIQVQLEKLGLQEYKDFCRLDQLHKVHTYFN